MKSAVFSVLLACALVSGCAHNQSEIKTEAKSEPVTNVTGSLGDRMRDLIEQEKSITPEQRAALLALSERVGKQQAQNQQLINQSKSLLMKEILSPNYNSRKANAIAKTIRNLYDEKIHVTIDAMQEAKSILNRLENREVFMNRMMDGVGRW